MCNWTLIAYSIYLSVPKVIADLVALVGLFLIKAPPPDFVYPCIFYIQVKWSCCMNTIAIAFGGIGLVY